MTKVIPLVVKVGDACLDRAPVATEPTRLAAGALFPRRGGFGVHAGRMRSPINSDSHSFECLMRMQ
jgi:hypothetical protein